MRIYLLSIIVALILASCNFNQDKTTIVERDTTITVENSFTELFLDSALVVGYAQKQLPLDSLSDKMISFYNQRNYQMAWFFPDGLSEFASTFLSLQDDYIHYSGDSSLADPLLFKNINTLKAQQTIHPNDSLVIETELALSQHFFNFASKAYIGSRDIQVQDLEWYIPRKKIDYISFLDSAIVHQGKNLSAYEPVNENYNRLKNELAGLYKFAKDSLPVLESRKVLKLGDSSEVIPSIKERLKIYHIKHLPDNSEAFDSTFLLAVKTFQKRMGLRVDGEIGPAFLREINTPIQQRIEQILINLERTRWLPKSANTDYILVNIPEYKLHYFEKGKKVFDMVVVVGSQAHSTVIFSGTINQIVFSPYWNVPSSILHNEILPGIRKNANYLARHNMEWVGKRVRQKPGIRNSLGLVKFLFPNSYSIYFHDTPSKSLFNEPQRAFSHGCIRLAEPKKLAEYLLRRDPLWTEETISEAMNSGTEKYVRLSKKDEVPVYLVYFTSWVDSQGELNFRKDIYGHDKKMAERLFQKTEKTAL